MVWLLALPFALAGCPGDDNGAADSGQCMCPAPTAQQVSYDNMSSELGAENVQDAIDELEARPTEAPVIPRLATISMQKTFPGETSGSAAANCPTPGDYAVSGFCRTFNSSNVTITGTEIVNGGGMALFACDFKQVAGTMDPITVGVVCLHAAQ
jgi:hypothetical protein